MSRQPELRSDRMRPARYSTAFCTGSTARGTIRAVGILALAQPDDGRRSRRGPLAEASGAQGVNSQSGPRALVESGQVVAHVVFDTGGFYAIGAVPDLDGDGLSDLILAGGGTGQEYAVGAAFLIGWSSNGPKKLGKLEAYDDDCGAEGTKGPVAHRILARPGAKPSFVRQKFTSPCEGNKWQKSGGEEPFEPEPDDNRYRLVR
jgi:hypothetical protein